MGYFNSKITKLMASGKATEEQTRAVIAMLDTEVFEPLMRECPEKHWRIMRRMHEIYYGCHYDMEFALWEVSQMEHNRADGTICKGEHWTIDQVKAVYEQTRARLSATDTIADVYVALHSWWHDNIEMDREDFGENAESKNIARGVAYFFDDDDAPDGKIWHYYEGMRAKC